MYEVANKQVEEVDIFSEKLSKASHHNNSLREFSKILASLFWFGDFSQIPAALLEKSSTESFSIIWNEFLILILTYIFLFFISFGTRTLVLNLCRRISEGISHLRVSKIISVEYLEAAKVSSANKDDKQDTLPNQHFMDVCSVILIGPVHLILSGALQTRWHDRHGGKFPLISISVSPSYNKWTEGQKC